MKKKNDKLTKEEKELFLKMKAYKNNKISIGYSKFLAWSVGIIYFIILILMAVNENLYVVLGAFGTLLFVFGTFLFVISFIVYLLRLL